MVSIQNLSTYASIFIIVPLLVAILAIQPLQGTDIGYAASMIGVILAYFAVMAFVLYLIFSRSEDGRFIRGVMAGILYGFINPAVASLLEGIPIVHKTLSIPAELAAHAGLDTTNPILYFLSFIAFWTIIFGAIGRILETTKGRKPKEA